jgi:hypothetical protein
MYQFSDSVHWIFFNVVNLYKYNKYENNSVCYVFMVTHSTDFDEIWDGDSLNRKKKHRLLKKKSTYRGMKLYNHSNVIESQLDR